MNKYTVSIIGVGSRGGEAYGKYMFSLKDKFEIISLCDVSISKLNKYKTEFNIADENCFTDEEQFFQKKRSDLLIISTLDKDHVRQAKKALQLGYHLLLEKPISSDKDECLELLEYSKKYNRIIMVCHVLRYTETMIKLKELLDSKTVGDLVFIDHTENVCFWHIAHSYVRGNWRKKEDTAPIILAKCCHDLDLLQYFAGSTFKSLSSTGSLFHFNAASKPQGAADRCVDCKYIKTCPYSAEYIYIDLWKKCGSPSTVFPYYVLSDEKVLTEDILYKAIKQGPYGKCVYSLDNNVADNQQVSINFENGVTANLKMMGFTQIGGRYIRFCGTQGEITLSEHDGTITIRPFRGEVQVLYTDKLIKDTSGGHSGADHRMINTLYQKLSDPDLQIGTTLENSIESHLMGIAAEDSMQKGGLLIERQDFV